MNLLVSGQLGSLKEVTVPLPPPKRYIPEKMVFENTEQLVKEPSSNNQNGINDISITYSIDNHSYYSGYNSTVNDNNKSEISNIATKSRFSDFGYINDNEAVSHYNKVKNVLMKNNLQFNNNFNQTQYDNLLMQYNNINLMNRNNMNPYMNQFMPNMMNNNLKMNMNMNMNMNMMMYQSMWGNYDPKIWGGLGIKNIKECFNNFTKAQNSWKHNEKKFVAECDF